MSDFEIASMRLLYGGLAGAAILVTALSAGCAGRRDAAGAFRGPARDLTWDVRPTGTTASLRGLHVVSNQVIWASGQAGTVLRSADSGDTWSLVRIAGADSFDIRAIHAIDAQLAHAVATAGRIWKTTDGGQTWTLRYQAKDTAVFLDAIAFFDDRRGIVLGDPIDGRFLILWTTDGGESWVQAPDRFRPEALPGEAAFAASGTALIVDRSGDAWLGTGVSAARVLRSADSGRTWVATETPLKGPRPTSGVFSVSDFARASDWTTIVAVGGDYEQPTSTRGTAAFSRDFGRTWQAASVPPRGYRSSVAAERRTANLAIATGPSGTDYTMDGGRSWAALTSAGFNAVQFAPNGTVFAVGAQGRVGRIDQVGSRILAAFGPARYEARDTLPSMP